MTDKPVAKLSSKMQGILSEWEQRGYKVKSASVRFVVAWKPKDAPKDEAETAVLLADLILLCKLEHLKLLFITIFVIRVNILYK